MKKTTYRQKINGKEKIKAFIFFSSQLIDWEDHFQNDL